MPAIEWIMLTSSASRGSRSLRGEPVQAELDLELPPETPPGRLVVRVGDGRPLVFAFWHYSRRLPGELHLWLLPLFWFGLEWFKGWFLTGMPWLSLGYSQTGSPLAGFAPLIGVYGIGALCLYMSVALFLLIRDKRYSLLILLLAIPIAGWMLQQVEWTEAQPEPPRPSR